MATITDLIQRKGVPLTVQGFWAGKFVTAPLVVTETVMVKLNAFGDTLWGPARWEPRTIKVTVNVAETPESVHNIDVAEIVLPSIGDDALVIFDDKRIPWVITWWPA